MSMPCPAPEIDGCTRDRVTNTATIIRRTAPTRSTHGARLKNIHQKKMPIAPIITPMRPTGSSTSGRAIGATT